MEYAEDFKSRCEYRLSKGKVVDERWKWKYSVKFAREYGIGVKTLFEGLYLVEKKEYPLS
jgi:hypothetical protein